MTAYVLSPRARGDLREIWNYTRDRWSVEQADRYVREINRVFATIADDPLRGRPCDHIRPGYRKYRGGAHMVFFRLIPTGVEVVRILHQSMDFERHL